MKGHKERNMCFVTSPVIKTGFQKKTPFHGRFQNYYSESTVDFCWYKSSNCWGPLFSWFTSDLQKRLCFIAFFKLYFPICASVNTLFTSGFLFPSYKPLILSSNWTSRITEVFPESCLHKKDAPGQVGPARSRSHPHRAALLSEWQKNNQKYKLYITTSSSCV